MRATPVTRFSMNAASSGWSRSVILSTSAGFVHLSPRSSRKHASGAGISGIGAVCAGDVSRGSSPVTATTRSTSRPSARIAACVVDTVRPRFTNSTSMTTSASLIGARKLPVIVRMHGSPVRSRIARAHSAMR